ncbi:MAG: AAA family ATPase, partial [Deltaproteobacteria bacterium]|nr:AAA family ATPase [Deltaproteobacteria bacterium]
MKIEKIRLKNLNSLAGEWEVDLTHPRYASDGLFAITGPTGSGKTTILDAVCLALYGRTPRLREVGKGQNEIMSRRTAECSAEVVFAVPGGRFLCQWSQHRARGRPDGALQPQKHVIARHPDGEILKSSVSATPKMVEELAGLDFDRFTRSALLAQGGFAAFLEADSGARSLILEQLTGTDIYQKISIKTHERRNEERRKFELAEAAVAGLKLLAPEQEEELRGRRDRLGAEAADLDADWRRRSAALAWREALSALEREAAALEGRRAALAQKTAEFGPQEQRLAWALRAVELAPDQAAVKGGREELERDQAAWRKAQDALPQLTAAAVEAARGRQAARQALDNVLAEAEALAPAIRQARELDLRLGELDQNVQAAAAELARAAGAAAETARKLRLDEAALGAASNELAELDDVLARTEADEALAELLPALAERAKGLDEQAKTLDGRRRETDAAKKAAQEAARAAQDAADRRRKLEDGRAAGQARVRAQAGRLEELLAGASVGALRAAADERRAETEAMKTAVGQLKDWLEAGAGLDEQSRKQEELAGQVKALAAAAAAAEEARAELERRADELAEELAAKKTFEDLSELRSALSPDRPCPLCGSTEHPWGPRTGPAAGQAAATDQALKKVRADLKATAEKVSSLRIRQARLDKDVETAELEARRWAAKAPEAQAALARTTAPWGLGEIAALTAGTLERRRLEAARAWEAARTAIQEAEELEARLAAERAAADQEARTAQDLERRWREA